VGHVSDNGNGTRNALIALGVVVLLGLVIAWFLHTYERVEREITLPPRGEASYNPLYALKKTLQAQGITVNSRQRLSLGVHPLGARDTLLVLNDPRSMTPVDARHLLDWVAGGGHLMLRTPPGVTEEDSTVPVLDALGILLTDESPECEPLQVEGEEHHVEFCSGRRFFFDFEEVKPLHSWGDLQAGYVYARIAHGRGKVDVLADFDFLTNSGPSSGNPFMADDGPVVGGLRDVPHRALARQLLAPNYGQGTVHLVYAAQMPSLWRRVLMQGWMVWVPLLLALLAWLWLRAQRFGPLLPPPATERRSLLEHVRASGAHLFRYHKRAPLYFAVRQSFLARLRRRDPFAASLHGEPQISAIAERLGVSANSVRVALQVPAPHDKLAFRDRISTLIQMRNRL
jgi:hypothetical protein